MSEFDTEFGKNKEKRRNSIKSKKNHRTRFIDEESAKKQHIEKKEKIKKKQSYLDEEWEKWNDYYNR